jgi:hypothetical protein
MAFRSSVPAAVEEGLLADICTRAFVRCTQSASTALLFSVITKKRVKLAGRLDQVTSVNVGTMGRTIVVLDSFL